MKELMIIFCVLTSLNEARAREVAPNFDPHSEEKCTNEVKKLECGSPIIAKEEEFLECVERKLGLLSPDCKRMYSFITRTRP